MSTPSFTVPTPSLSSTLDLVPFPFALLFQEFSGTRVDRETPTDTSVNGNSLPVSAFIAITSQYRSTTSGHILNIQDLNIVPTDSSGRTGVVAQLTTYETEDKGTGKKVGAKATTIVAVEQRGERRVIAGIWEAQSQDA